VRSAAGACCWTERAAPVRLGRSFADKESWHGLGCELGRRVLVYDFTGQTAWRSF
jgi:hypothetical protein